jgi:hypothetical protein
MRQPIQTATAYRMRFHCGLMLPPEREYEDPRFQEIAKEQEILFKRLEELDQKLQEIAKQTCDPKELDYPE